MEPERQVEIQLGHMCNNRCVFCVSGQRTADGEARPMALEPILESIRDARGRGHRKITLLGGEPTLQPGFLPVVRECVALGFDEIVVFTNGAKTARPAFIDEVRATGGRFTWRISIQGATEESHERTTRKRGSFGRIVRTLEALHARGERITINMCVVRSNYEDVDRFPELLLPYGASQLHLDMMRPLDAGRRTEEELRATIPRHSDLVGPLTRMVEGFPEGFDVNIGNVPYCVAPHLAPWIHHDGERTDTIAIDGDDALSRPWNKYLVKRRDKIKPERCGDCVFVDRCSGVFETYARFHGTDELVPITQGRLSEIDPDRRFLALHLRPLVDRLDGWSPEERGVEETHLSRDGSPSLRVALRAPDVPGGFARVDGVSLHLLSSSGDTDRDLDALRALCGALHGTGRRVVHPVGDDALRPLARSIAVRLARLRAAAPFGRLRWSDVLISSDGRRAELPLEGPDGELATVWLAEEGRRATGGYTVDGEPTDALVDGLREVMSALRITRARSVPLPPA